MESETSSSVDEQVVAGGGGGRGADTRGKHRIFAELKRVEQEINFLEDELGELQGIDNLSTMCKELLHNIETLPDPLVPVTNGPVDPVWDRWFEGPQDLQGCSCFVL